MDKFVRREMYQQRESDASSKLECKMAAWRSTQHTLGRRTSRRCFAVQREPANYHKSVRNGFPVARIKLSCQGEIPAYLSPGCRIRHRNPSSLRHPLSYASPESAAPKAGSRNKQSLEHQERHDRRPERKEEPVECQEEFPRNICTC